MDHDPLHKELIAFLGAFFSYTASRLHRAGLNFESVKNVVVDMLLTRRGANTPLFVHISIILMAIGVLVTGGVLSTSSVISGSYPGVAANPLVASSSEDLSDQRVITSTITPVTVISDKPRDKILDYQVKSGDTVSSIASSFGV